MNGDYGNTIEKILNCLHIHTFLVVFVAKYDTIVNNKYIMEKQIEVNGVTIELTDEQVNRILEQTKIKVRKELVKQEILEMLEKYKSNVRFLDVNGEASNYPTSRFEILDKNGEWLFDIDYDSKNPRFLYSFYRVWIVFFAKYSINYDDFQEVIKSILEEHLSLNGITPLRGFE